VASQLDRLVRVGPGEPRVVSCYLKLEPRDRARGKYLIKLKNRVRTVTAGLERLGLERSIRDAAERDLSRVVEHLRDPANLPPTQGLAAFACEAVDLFEAIPLPLVHRSRLAVDRTPLVRELASVDEEFGRLLAVVFDRTRARFFEVTAYGALELPGLRADSTRGARFRSDRDSPGWGEHAYHNRIREEKQRHLEAIARELFSLDRRRVVQGLILASAGADANALRPFLHTYVAERVLGSVKLSPKDVTPARVHAEALVIREAWERASERALVAGLAERLGAGWAVNGIPPTLRALARGQVRALLVHADGALPGFRCSETGRLVLTERECRGEGDAIPVLDVVDDAIEEALRQGVDVNVVYDPDACRRIEGLAGFLRFRR
jgi:peptide subunit release factor 1 (eRF1)